TVDAARELIQLRRDNHDDLSSFLIITMKGYGELYPTNCFLIEGSPHLPLNIVEN
ncbi:10566_t:CDS:1, partial [Funneliformis geosporum]